MGLWIQILGLLLSLSILIILHELGHFTFARLFKTRVEKFYLFFDAWKIKLFKIKKGDTEYGIGWLPLGGYVKISGMIDESMDKKAMKEPPKPHEFRSKKTWQRLLIMVGGVMVNFLLALVIYSMILFVWGQKYIPVSEAKYGFVCDSLLLDNGIKNGDFIYRVDTFNLERYEDINSYITFNDARTIYFKRDGKEMQVQLPENFNKKLIKHEVGLLIFPRVPFIADSILPDRPAAKSELQKNDKILGINDIETPYFTDFAVNIKKFKDQDVKIKIERNGEIQFVDIKVAKEGIIGVGNKPPEFYLKTKTINYSFLESIPAGIKLGTQTMGKYINSMKYIFTKEGITKVGGFGTIKSIFPKEWNWGVFWERTALLSLILAFMNILPIPALDGGHVLFLLYEMVTGRKPGDKFMEYAQIVGMILLLALLVFANANDVIRGKFSN